VLELQANAGMYTLMFSNSRVPVGGKIDSL